MGRKRKTVQNSSTNGLLSTSGLVEEAVVVEVVSSTLLPPSKRLRSTTVRSTMNHEPPPKSKPVVLKTTAAAGTRKNPSRNRSVLLPADIPQVGTSSTSAVRKSRMAGVKKVGPKNIKRIQNAGIRKNGVGIGISKGAKKGSRRALVDKVNKSKIKTGVLVNGTKKKKIFSRTKSSLSVLKTVPVKSLKRVIIKKLEEKKGVKVEKATTVTVKKKQGEKVSSELKVEKKSRRKGGFVLCPKPVTEYLVEPTFHTNVPIPYISPMFQGKLLIRAVVTGDKAGLSRLVVQEKKKLYSYCIPRSVSVDRTALHYALMKEDVGAVKLLMNSKQAEKLGPISEWLIQAESTGRGSHMMFGHGLRIVTAGRGGKEGNAALLKDKGAYGSECSRVEENFVHNHILAALESGMKMSTLEKIASLNKETEPHFWHGWLSSIVYAVRAGQNGIAGQLVELAIKKSGFGFNLLHQEVLVKTSKSPLSPFKSVSVLKKSIGNARITPIHCAAINPDPYSLTTLMTVLPDFNVLDGNNWSPIHYAAVCTGPGPLKYLLSRGASTNMIDKDGNTPLHAGARCGRIQNVKLIIQAEFKLMDTLSDDDSLPPEITSISKINKIGLSPLHIAAKYGHPEVVTLLLHLNHVDGNKSTSALFEKMTPLMFGCEQGHIEVVKVLVGAGMKLELGDRRGRTALAHAVINGHADIVSYLLRLGDNHLAKDTSGNTLVHYAAAYGWYFNLKLLMEAGCCPNEPNQWKMTPIAIAFMKGHMGLVELLLRQPGVNVNSIIDDSKGMTLLLQTCSFKAGEEMLTRLKFLVETQKADCSITDSEKCSAVHYLIQSEAKEIKILKEQKARGWEVEERKDVYIVEALKLVTSKGCSLGLKNSVGLSGVELGIDLGCFSLVELLLNLGGSISSEPTVSGDTVLHLLADHIKDEDGFNFFKSYCTKNPGILEQMKGMRNVYNSEGMSPLLSTLSEHSRLSDPLEVKRVVEFLLFLVVQLDSDVNARVLKENGKPGDSVLHLAVQTNYSEHVLDILLTKKPLLETVDENGRTALVVAVLKRREAAVKILVEHGANVNFSSFRDDNKSIIMLEVSQKLNSFSLIPFLIEKGAVVKDVSDPFNGNSVLHFVSKSPTSGSVPAIKSLQRVGLDPNVQNKYGRTSLHLAVNSRGGETDVSYEVERELIDSGASLIIRDVHGRIPLHFAFLKIGKKKVSSTGFMDPIELVTLLTSSAMKEKGNQIDVSDEFGQLPIHCAAGRGATISASHLLALTGIKNKGLLVDMVDSNGNSPFALSVMNGHEGCALMFLQAGANFLNDLNRCSDTKKVLESFGNEFVWKPLKQEAENQDNINTSKSKYSILQEIVRRDWQGLLYLMLEKLKTSGVGVSPGIEAALKTTRLTLAAKLIDRVRFNSELITKKQSLIHTLAQEAPSTSETKEVQCRILNGLIQKGADVNSVDEHQSTPLIYAAVQWNWILCTELTKLMNLSPILKPDYLGRTPFSALFWNPIEENKEMSLELRSWAESLIYSGSGDNNGNILTQYPIRESTTGSTVRFIPSSVTITTNTNLSSLPAVKYSPLIMSIIYGNYGIVKWLLDGLKPAGKIDINYRDSLGRTPIMHAAKLNDIQMIKLLLDPGYDWIKDKTPFCNTTLIKGKQKFKVKIRSELDLNLRDKNGWSVVHHVVAPRSPSTIHYDQAGSLLELLWSVGADFRIKSNSDETPLQMSLGLKQFKMSEFLMKMMKMSRMDLNFEEFEPIPNIIESWVERIPIEVSESDSKKMLSKMEEGLMDLESDEALAVPDSLSGQTPDTSVVVIDEGRQVPFDCLLTQVDLNYGIYGLYNFYKMQLIQGTKGPELLILFTRWGRVGEDGQYQKTPFPTLEEATKEFKKIFRSKTGNTWDELNLSGNFTQYPKKYRLVNLDIGSRPRYKSNYYGDKVRIDFEQIQNSIESMESKLSSSVVELLKKLSFVHKNNSNRIGKSNLEHLPFGLLSRESLQTAWNILEKLEKDINEKDLISGKADYNQEEYGKLMNSVIELSEEFYGLILVSGFGSEKICPLFTIADLRKKQELIRNLLHHEFAIQLLLAAQFNQNHIHPMDYVYGAIGTRLQHLDPDTEEIQILLEYIHNTSCDEKSYIIEGIYRIQVPGEEEKLNSAGIGNRHLLWHGTSTANLLSILHRGLQVAPLGYAFHGALFGQGVYLCDMFSKGYKYCRESRKGSKFMLLCEVALGNIQKVDVETSRKDNEQEPLKPNRQSLRTSNSKWKPLPRATLNWKGRVVAVGPKCENILPEKMHHGLDFNEYVVFKPEQVNLRYLIQFNDSTPLPKLNMNNLFK